MGWSYGGYMTSAIITQTRRFKARLGGSGAAEPDVVRRNDGYSRIHVRLHGGRILGPLRIAGRAHSPLFRIKGTTHAHADPARRQRTCALPISQGYELYNALKRQGTPVKMIVYPRQAPRAPRAEAATRCRPGENVGMVRPVARDREDAVTSVVAGLPAIRGGHSARLSRFPRYGRRRKRFHFQPRLPPSPPMTMGAVASRAFDQFDCIDRVGTFRFDRQVPNLLIAKPERQLRARHVHHADVVGEVHAVSSVSWSSVDPSA